MNQTKDRKAWFACMVVFMAVMWLQERASAQSWYTEPDVYYASTGEAGKTEEMIKYALWSIRQRSGISGNYKGITGQGQVNGAITVMWVSGDYISAVAGSPYYSGWATWSFSWDGYMLHARVFLNADAIMNDKERQWVITHELGHALAGEHHHSVTGGVFSQSGHQPYDYALTTQDALELPYNQRSLCHAELTAENDIFLPDAAGNQVMLRYRGNMEWELAQMVNNPFSQGCSNASIDSSGVVRILDVRGFNGNLSRVELTPIANNRWALLWAE